MILNYAQVALGLGLGITEGRKAEECPADNIGGVE